MNGRSIFTESHPRPAALQILRWVVLVAALAWLAVAACGDEVEPPVPSSISLSPMSADLSFLGDTAVFEATVLDQHGTPMPGASVMWSGDSPDIFSVAPDGPDRGRVTALANGSGRVRATSAALTAVAPVSVEQVPVALEVHSGDGQEVLRGRSLREPVVVRVLDSGGSPVFGVEVLFAPAAGQGTVDPPSAVSDTSGLAATVWTLGGEAGEQILAASVADGPRVEVTARALTPDEAVDTVKVHAGDGQERLRGWPLREPVVVAVVDAWGEPVPGATVDFAPGEGGGSAGPAAVESDTSGLAATVWTLGGEAGEQALTASVADGPSAEVTARALTPDEAVDTVKVHAGDGQERLRGWPLREPVVVRVVDAWGEPVPGATIDFAPAEGGGSADPAAVESDTSGLAATVWTLGGEAGEQVLTASVADRPSAELTALALTPDEAVDTVKVHAGDGQERLGGWPLRDPVVVAVVDAWGEPVPGATIGFAPGEGGGSADPAAVESDTSGLAAAVWTLGGEAGEQVLTASVADGPSAEVTARALTPDEAVDTVNVQSGDGQERLGGRPLREPVVVRVVDAWGEQVPGATIDFAPAEGGGSADPAAVESDTSGLAATVWTLGGEAGEQVLTASVADGPSAEVTARALTTDEAVDSLEAYAGDGQRVLRGKPLPQPVVVRVLDAWAEPVPGVLTIFQPGEDAGSADPWVAESDTSGLAWTVWTVGDEAGLQTLTVSAAGVRAEFSAEALAPDEAADSLEVYSGDRQVGIRTKPLPEPVVVRVLDAHDLPVPGVKVVFETERGTVDPASALSDSLGLAVARWTLPECACWWIGLGASVAGGPPRARFVAMSRDPEDVVATVELVSGGDQRGLRGQPLPEPIVVRFLDTRGVPVEDADGKYRLKREHGRVGPSTRSDSAGIASTVWTLGEVAGEQELIVRPNWNAILSVVATAVLPDDFVDTVEVHSGGGQRALVGRSLPEPVVVRLLDEGGRPVHGATVVFSPGEGHGTVDSASVSSDSAGMASTVWTLGDVAGEHSLAASVGDEHTATVLATALAPEEAVETVEVHSGDGQWAIHGEALPEPVVIRVLDAAGSPVPGAGVVFLPDEGHGATDPDSAVSDSTGLASVVWTLGEKVGEQIVTASVPERAEVEVAATAVRDEGVCARTPQVSEALARTAGVRSCAEVTARDLAGIDILHLQRANIAELRSGDFKGLTNLRWLYLSNNRLSSLPPDLFSESSKINILDLNNNEFSEVPTEALSALWQLSWLRLDYNNLGNLSPDAFAGLESVEVLRLRNNGIVELPPGVFRDLRQLESLHLFHNELTGLPPDIFAGLTRLKTIGLSDNRQLRELPAHVFRGLSNLEILWLPRTGLKELPPDIFSGLQDLRLLDLDNTKLAEIPAGLFKGLSGLTVLGLERMWLRELPSGIFAGLGSLRTLRLDQNHFTELPAGVFANLANLENLRFSQHRLDSLPARAFAGTSGLRLVDMRRRNSVIPLTLHLRRVDSDDPQDEGPADVVAWVVAGAPAELRVPVSVQGGTVSATTLVVKAGDTISRPIEVKQDNGSTDPTYVTLGLPDFLPPKFQGMEPVAGEQLVLFAEADNHSPVARKAIQEHWLQVDGPNAELALDPYFRDPDGDPLSYEAVSADPGVVAATTNGGRLWLDPRSEGLVQVEVTAVDPDGLRASQPMAVKVRPPPDQDAFNVEVVFRRGFTEKQKAEILEAAERWTEVIEGDLPDVPVDGDLPCIGDDPRVVGSVDDLVVLAVPDFEADDAGLAYAFQCGVREGSGLAYVGDTQYVMWWFERYPEFFKMREVGIHEIGHIVGIGIGEPWEEWKREPEDSTPDPHFAGPLAIEAFDSAGGEDYPGNKVPLEINRSGRAGSHWREDVMEAEIMSPVYGGKILSAITLQALADMGYDVDLTEADDYSLNEILEMRGDEALPDTVPIPVDVVRRGPVVVVDRNGKVVRVIRN